MRQTPSTIVGARADASGVALARGVFHVVNAYEDGERTCIDVAAYLDAAIIARLLEPTLAEPSGCHAAPPCWSMRPGVEAHHLARCPD